MIQLKNYYNTKIKKQLFQNFFYKNIHEIPKITKIIFTCNFGNIAYNNPKYFQKVAEDMIVISGQYPLITKTTKSAFTFKIRRYSQLGLKITLRNEKMFIFLEKLIKFVLPRIKYFKGLFLKSFDKHGNFSLGLEDYTVFLEMQNKLSNINYGFNINIVTSAISLNDGSFLLKKLGLPIINSENL